MPSFSTERGEICNAQNHDRSIQSDLNFCTNHGDRKTKQEKYSRALTRQLTICCERDGEMTRQLGETQAWLPAQCNSNSWGPDVLFQSQVSPSGMGHPLHRCTHMHTNRVLKVCVMNITITSDKSMGLKNLTKTFPIPKYCSFSDLDTGFTRNACSWEGLHNEVFGCCFFSSVNRAQILSYCKKHTFSSCWYCWTQDHFRNSFHSGQIKCLLQRRLDVAVESKHSSKTNLEEITEFTQATKCINHSASSSLPEKN